MRSRPPARRPDGRVLIALAILALLSLGAAWREAAGDGEPPPSSSDPPPQDHARVWVFLSPAAEVSGGVVAGVEALGGRIRVRSRWLRAISVELPRGRVAALENLPGVVGVRPVGLLGDPGSRETPPPAAVSNPPRPPAEEIPSLADSSYGTLGATLDLVEIPQAHALDLLGSGVRIGILDGLFWLDHAVVRGSPPLETRDFVEGDADVGPGPQDPLSAAAHGTALWSLVAGDRSGLLRGASPGAGILLARVRGTDPLVRADEDRWVEGLEWLESRGARIVLSGVGFRTLADTAYSIGDLNGDVTPSTRAADEAARRGVLVVAPVGNGGPGAQSLEAPSDGDSVLAAGAVDRTGLRATFSAQGPTGDGRSKPDVVAPGEALPAASTAGDLALAEVTGTEFAGALLAGAAALLVEAYPQMEPMGVLTAMRDAARPDTGAFGGVPRVASAVVFPQGVRAIPLGEVDGQGRVTSLAPQFQWDVPVTHPLALPVTFHLQLAPDSLFRDVVLTDSVVGTFARRLPVPLPSRSRLFWRVEARSRQGVRRASAYQGPLEIPSWVALEVLNDPGGSETGDATPEFSWRPLPLPPPAGPFVFDLEIFLEREGEVIQAHRDLEATRLRIPDPLPYNVPLRWRVLARSVAGAVDTVASAGPFVVTSTARPPATILYQNFPNPFPNPEVGGGATRIWFDLDRTSQVELAVFDLRGRLVRRLIPGPGCGPVELPAGLYGREDDPPSDPCLAFSWSGRDDGGSLVPRGVYLLRLRAGGVVDVRRVVFWP